jgi:hypothetical protein
MGLRSTQRLSEMSTRNLPGSNGQPERKADNLTAIYEPIVWKMWEPRRAPRAARDSFTFYLYPFLLPTFSLDISANISSVLLFCHIMVFINYCNLVKIVKSSFCFLGLM